MIPFPFNENRFSFLLQTCDTTPRAPRTYQLLWNNSVLAGDSSSGPLGYLTFLYSHKKYNRGSGRKRTNDKRTIWACVNSKCKKGSFVTLHSMCICRLTLACICAKLLQATRNANSSLTVFLTADRCRHRTANSSCLSSSLPLDSISCRLASSAVRFKWGPHHATSHFRSRLESQHQSVPGCSEECGDPLVQSGDRWQTLGVAAGLGAGSQVQRDPGLASEGVLRLCTLLSLPPPPPTWTRWTISFGHTLRTSPTWPPTTPKPAWSPSSAEYSPNSRRRLWKRHASCSGSVSRRWLRLKAVTLNRCQLYYIINLPELIFFNKSFKIKLQCCFL